MMDTFFPSEIARLVLGYLKEDNCLKSWQTFLEESSNLREYFTLFKQGKVYSTNVNGCSLSDILNEYSVLKFESIKRDPKAECSSSKSEIIGTLKEDGFVQSTNQTVDCHFENSLTPSDGLKDNVSTDPSPNACELPNHNNCDKTHCNKKIKKHCTDVDENLSISSMIKSHQHCNEENPISAKNSVNKSYEQDKTQGYQRNKRLKTVLDTERKRNDHLNLLGVGTKNVSNMYQTSIDVRSSVKRCSKDISSSDTTADSLTSFIQSLSDKLNRKGSPAKLPNVQHRHDLKATNQPLKTPISSLKLLDEENTVSSTETILLEDDDDDSEIYVVDIKRGEKCSDNLDSKGKTSCSNDTTANQNAVDNVAEENTQINEPKHETNSSTNSNVEVLGTYNLKDIKTEQTNANNQNKINIPESKTGSSINQVSFIDSGTFIQPSASINEMSFSYPQNYILPSYAPSNSFTNNAPVYVVLNTPAASSGPIINGTILTVPSVQTNNVPCSVLPAVSTTFVNSPITAPVNNLPSLLETTNTVANVDTISFPSSKAPHNEILTTVPVNPSNTSKKNNSSKAKVNNKALKNSHKTYSKESHMSLQLFSEIFGGCNDDESSKVSKRKKSPQKGSQKKNKKSAALLKDQVIPTPKSDMFLSLIDYHYKGADSNEGMSEISVDNDLSDIKKVTKTRSSRGRKCKNKTSDVSPRPLKVKIVRPKRKTSLFQSLFEEPQHDETGHNSNPSNVIAGTKEEVNDCSKSISTFSTSSQNIFIDPTLIKSSPPDVEDNRVLKVMLSDIFVDSHHEIDSLHDQESDSNTELSVQEMGENQISDSEKITVQNPKSPVNTIM